MKKVFISGASGGIGIAVAKKFLSDGYTVIAQYNTDENGISILKDYADKIGAIERLFVFKCDLSDGADTLGMLGKIKSAFKYIDVVINCAGASLYKLITDTTDAEWDRIFNINMKSIYQINNAFIGQMVERSSGKIINVSSMWGSVGASMEVAYSASKSAVIGYTKALAKELAPSKINVNCVCPGIIDTKMNARFSLEEKAVLCSETPLGRLGNADEVASLIYYLSSSDADFITGQIITIDGGFTL